MDKNRRVVHGTPIHDQPSLCGSCRHAQRVRGLTQNQEYTICDRLSTPYDRIRMKVVECSTYSDKATPTLRDMESIAWNLVTSKSANQIGFMSPADFRKAKKKGVVEEPETLRNPITGDYEY